MTENLENRVIGGELKNHFSSTSGSLPAPTGVRSKSSNRIRYEAEASHIQKKLGDLEAIRQSLGLSQRKICQLLLVDPSAWTRWTKQGDSAPPHIYRALQWYLALQEKYPALDVRFWLGTVPTHGSVASEDRVSQLVEEVTVVRTRVDELSTDKRRVEELALIGASQAAEIANLRRKLSLLVIATFALTSTLIGILFWLGTR